MRRPADIEDLVDAVASSALAIMAAGLVVLGAFVIAHSHGERLAQDNCRDRGGMVVLLADGDWRCVGARAEGE